MTTPMTQETVFAAINSGSCSHEQALAVLRLSRFPDRDRLVHLVEMDQKDRRARQLYEAATGSESVALRVMVIAPGDPKPMASALSRVALDFAYPGDRKTVLVVKSSTCQRLSLDLDGLKRRLLQLGARPDSEVMWHARSV